MEQERIQDQLAKISAKMSEIGNGKIQNQLANMSAKLTEIDNRLEPVYAFRVTSVKDSGSSNQQSVNKNPGKMFI